MDSNPMKIRGEPCERVLRNNTTEDILRSNVFLALSIHFGFTKYSNLIVATSKIHTLKTLCYLRIMSTLQEISLYVMPLDWYNSIFPFGSTLLANSFFETYWKDFFEIMPWSKGVMMIMIISKGLLHTKIISGTTHFCCFSFYLFTLDEETECSKKKVCTYFW